MGREACGSPAGPHGSRQPREGPWASASAPSPREAGSVGPQLGAQPEVWGLQTFELEEVLI